MNKFEEVLVNQKEVVCDGGAGALGHPRVFLHIDQEKGRIVCPYCSKTFILNSDSSLRKAAH